MNQNELLAKAQKCHGDEYPAALMVDGSRVPLSCESRFSRSYSYHFDGQKTTHHISRFTDGSASITASQLKHEWPSWTEDLRLDFCQSYYWFPDPEILRFIMERGEQRHWSAVANLVASELPRDEAFKALIQALQNTEIGKTANIIQGIAITKHPDAEATLRLHFTAVWAHPALWDNSDFVNWMAYNATVCIRYLIKLDAPPVDFIEQVRQLSKHICVRNRDSCRNYLSKFYPEISFPN
jgi:hypothetical protein